MSHQTIVDLFADILEVFEEAKEEVKKRKAEKIIDEVDSNS